MRQGDVIASPPGYATVSAYVTHLNKTIQQNVNLWTNTVVQNQNYQDLLQFRSLSDKRARLHRSFLNT